jgi:AbrB family looped-hinge helix DNA binding protein
LEVETCATSVCSPAIQYGNFNGMKNSIETTIDAAGRLVIPKAVRVMAGIEPDMRLRVRCRDGVVEIEPQRRAVRVQRKGHVCVATPVEPSEPLDNDTVREVTQAMRSRDES